jgi:SLOG cluster2
MNLTRLNVSLGVYEIGLSGAVPDRQDWSENAMDRGILEFVALFSGLVFKYGGRIVHGSHPTFTPVILRQARLHAPGRNRKPVTMVMSELWAKDLSKEDVESITDIAEFVVTPIVGQKGPYDHATRNSSLTAMRKVLVDSQNLMVAVGGKLHSTDGFSPGVGEELELAKQRKIPRFLIGGLGGYSQILAQKLTPTSLNNKLSRQANIALFGSQDVAASVSTVFEHLAQSKALRELVRSPQRQSGESNGT